MKNRTSTFAFKVALTTTVVGALALCAWFIQVTFKTFLQTPHTYGDITIIPHGHDMEGVLTHHWDSLLVISKRDTFRLKDLDFDITVIGEGRGLSVKTEELNVKLSAAPPQDSATPPTDSGKEVTSDFCALEFPEKAKFYLPTQLLIHQANVDAGGSHQWSADSIVFNDEGIEKARLRASHIRGEFIDGDAALDISANFTGKNLVLKGAAVAGSDSVTIDVRAPKDDLGSISAKTSVEIKDPTRWIPAEIPPEVPELGRVNLNAEVTFNPRTGEPKYKARFKTRIGEFWPLLPLNVDIQVDGTLKNYHVVIQLTNDEGGLIFVEGDLDDQLNGDATGRVEKMSAEFGPQIMPMDMVIHSAHKVGDTLEVVAETPQGSVVEGSFHFDDEFNLTYFGDLSPHEAWAIDWNFGLLELGDRFKAYGSFRNGKMRTLVKIPNVTFAYFMKADSVQTVLLLDENGIDFSDGIIYTPKETFDFTGDVKWDAVEDMHTSWNVTQRHGGHASAYVSFQDSILIDVKTDSVEISTIPFATFKLNEQLDGHVTGHWNWNYDSNVGFLEAAFDGNFQPFNLQGNIRIRENGDTVFIEKAEARQKENKVEGEATFILPNDSNPEFASNFNPTGTFPLQVLHAWASAREFDIPLLLQPLNDTTFSSGRINGNIAFNENHGLQGNIDFSNLKFNNIPPQLFNIKKMNMFADNNKMELNAYLGIGGGGWTGTTQIILDDIFKPQRHVSVSHNSDNGGDLYAEGFIDSTLTFKGQLNVNGSWFIPGTISEIRNTDLSVDVSARIREGLRGITADIRCDSTRYQPPRINYQFPVRARGHLEDGILDITEASTRNANDEVVNATLQYDLNNLRLKAIDFSSEGYTLQTGKHTLKAENISGHMEETEDDIIISANLPVLRYAFHDNSMGDAEATGKGELNLTIPHAQEGIIQNNTINGNILVDRMVYTKELEIEVNPSTLDKFISMFNNAIAKLKKTETQESKLSSASPINLSVHISDSQSDSIQINTPFATFPLTFDIWVLGNTNRPLLRGDVSNANTGFIGIQNLYEFDLNSFRISWNDVIWQHGIIDVSSTQELPYCDDTKENQNETCPVNLDIQGTITAPQPTPSSNCGNESSSAAIYYNIFLGCIANDFDESTDWNKLAGKAIGKALSTTANKTLGGAYIGDIDMKVMFFNSNTTSEKDSSYFKIPISLDRWIKDMSLTLGYTQDQSENPTYDQALQFGLNYTLPVFREEKYSHKNHLSPTLSVNALLISKQYLTNTGTENNENRIEKNIGVNYVYRFWNPCLLGIGKCESYEEPELGNHQLKKKED